MNERDACAPPGRPPPATPRVSLGLPVYNGQEFLEEVLDRVVSQTFDDFELIICDNASTDATPEICRRYAASDPRIRYLRNAKNIGAGPNFNLAFRESTGEYFKWLACDDLITTDFLERTVAVLDTHPDVVLAFSLVNFIDEHGVVVDNNRYRTQVEHPDPVLRFRSLLLDPHLCLHVFGLIRAETLRSVPLMGSYSHADGILLERLALRGPFRDLSEHLFFSRRHDRQSMAVFQDADGRVDYRHYAVWFDPSNQHRVLLPMWRLLGENFVTALRSGLPPRQYVAAHLLVLRWVIRKRSRLVEDAVLAVRTRWSTLRRSDSRCSAERP